jgi:hypothetical protein
MRYERVRHPYPVAGDRNYDMLASAPREWQSPEAAQITEPAMWSPSETPSRASTSASNCLVVSTGSPSFLHRSARVPTRSRREWSRYCDRSIIDPHRQRRQR